MCMKIFVKYVPNNAYRHTKKKILYKYFISISTYVCIDTTLKV